MPWTTTFTRLPPVLDPVAVPNEALSTVDLAWARAVMHDTFSREVGPGGWGTPEIGPAYVVQLGAAANLSVTGGVGKVAHAAAATNRHTAAVNVRDVRLIGHVRLDKLPTGALAQWMVHTRYVDATNFYRLVVNHEPDGTVDLSVQRVVANVFTTLVTLSNVLTGIGAEWLRYRIDAEGASPTTLRVKVWLDGATEPTAWNWEGTDSSAALQVAAGVAYLVLTQSTMTNFPVVFEWDGLAVIDLAAPGGAADPRFESYRIWRTANGMRELVDEPTDYADPTLIDWTAPTGVPLVYEITQYDGWQESVAVVVQAQVFETPTWFLVVPDEPDLAFPLEWVRPGFSRVEDVRMAARYPLGRSTPIVVSGPTRRPTGDMALFVVRDLDQIARIREAATRSRSEPYAVLKTGTGEALLVKLGAVSEQHGEAGVDTVSVPYITVR